MQIPVEIVFHGLDRSEAVEGHIREYVGKLEKFHGRVTSCRVVVEREHRHHLKGQLYHVIFDVTVPGREIVVGREPGRRHSHEDLRVALHDAYKAARRKLQDHVRHVRGKEKLHRVPPHGRVASIFPQEGYGFVVTPSGREVYFHRNAVFNDAFDALAIGDEVRFTEEQGEKGVQATTVRRVGRHHHLAP